MKSPQHSDLRGWPSGLSPYTPRARSRAKWVPAYHRNNLRGSKITDLRGVYYVSFKFSDFVLKIGSIGGAKFGSAQKMSYLCTRNHESNKAGFGHPMQLVEIKSNTM